MMKNNCTLLRSLKASLKRVRVACSTSYAKKQQLKTEFSSLVPIESSPEQSPDFVSRVCPPMAPSPFNVLILHPSVVSLRRQLEAEFASMVPFDYSLDQCRPFVSSVCPPLTPTPFNQVVLHPSVVARRRRQQQVADKLCLLSLQKFYDYTPIQDLKIDYTNRRHCRLHNFQILMIPRFPREGLSCLQKGAGTYILCQPEFYQEVVASRQQLFIRKLNKLASEGRLRLPRKGSAARSA